MFLVVSQTIAATPPLLSLQMARRSPKTGQTRGVSQTKLASEAYRAIGASHEIVSPIALQWDTERVVYIVSFSQLRNQIGLRQGNFVGTVLLQSSRRDAFSFESMFCCRGDFP